MKDFILKMQEEKRKMSKNEKLQGKYDRFRRKLYTKCIRNR